MSSGSLLVTKKVPTPEPEIYWTRLNPKPETLNPESPTYTLN